MFVTPKWDIGDVSEKLNFELFGCDSSAIRKKLKKKKKKKVLEADKNGINQNILSSVTKQNSGNFSTLSVEHNTKKSKRRKMKLGSVSKLNKIKNIQSKSNTNFSLYDREELPSSKNKTSVMQSTKPLLNSGMRRKRSISSDSTSLELKTKKENSEFFSKNDHSSILKSSDKEIHSSERKLSENGKRKQKKKKKRERQLATSTNIASKDLSHKCETEGNIQSRALGKQRKKQRLVNSLKISKDVETKDLLLNKVSEMNVQSDVSKEQKSPYQIQKLKNILKMSSNSKQSLEKNTGFSKQKKNEGTLRERMMRKLKASRFRYLNEQLYTSAKECFQLDPETFHAYHEGYQQQVRQWPINPLDVIIKSLQKKSSELVIADFGCGDARLARSVPNLVHSFDLVAVSKEITACDMACTPLSNTSVDVVVFCLSLMGNNLATYLAEANRVLKEGGLMKIAEVESRFDGVEIFIHNLNKFGFVNTWKDLSHNLFYFLDFKKERCISKKMKSKLPEITLKPCLYKKR